MTSLVDGLNSRSVLIGRLGPGRRRGRKFFHLPSTFSMILGVLPSMTATAELVVPRWIHVKNSVLDDAMRNLKLLTQIDTDDLALHLLTSFRGVPSPDGRESGGRGASESSARKLKRFSLVDAVATRVTQNLDGFPTGKKGDLPREKCGKTAL